jgi:UDP-N-acetylglucosamine/UDP-N-acetylgalactosamine 4-epimerase
MAKFLVTGAAGFIGSNIVELLLDNDEQVVGLDNLSTGSLKNLDFVNDHKNKNSFKLIKGDIRNLDDCLNASNNVDYILHLAALASVPESLENPALYHENNITGTMNMLEAARQNKVKRFVFSSSAAIYGDTKIIPTSEKVESNPLSPYALNKLQGEEYCSFYNKIYGVKTVILRYFNIFGPKQNPDSQYAAVVPKFITAFKNKKTPIIYGDGLQTRDFVYVKNIAAVNRQACYEDMAEYGVPINIGSGVQIDVNTLGKFIKETFESEIDFQYLPTRAGDIKYSVADIKKYETSFPNMKLTSFDEGLFKTIQWYKKHEI